MPVHFRRQLIVSQDDKYWL